MQWLSSGNLAVQWFAGLWGSWLYGLNMTYKWIGSSNNVLVLQLGRAESYKVMAQVLPLAWIGSRSSTHGILRLGVGQLHVSLLGRHRVLTYKHRQGKHTSKQWVQDQTRMACSSLSSI